MTDWSTCPAVESVPGKVSGAWVFTGTGCLCRASSKASRAEPPWRGIPGMVRGSRRVEGKGRIAARGHRGDNEG